MSYNLFRALKVKVHQKNLCVHHFDPDKQYYLYFDEEGHLVITFSEPETNGVLVNYSYVDGKWNIVLTTNED